MKISRRVLLASFVSVFLVATATARGADKHLRFIEGPNGSGRLQTSLVTLRDQRGRKVTLVAAVHVADAAYYKALNGRFRKYDAVLFELVAPNGTLPTPGDTDHGAVSRFQHLITDLLGLKFQLDEIDYSAPNFVHADMDPKTFFRKEDERGESLIGLMVQSMLANMNSPDEQAADIDPGELLAALFSPDRPRRLKLILGREFQDIDDQLAGIEGSVLLAGRNQAALKVLREQLALGRKNLAIFYGAGHMSDMQKRLEKMGFVPIGTQWITAWNIPPAPATRPSGSR